MRKSLVIVVFVLLTTYSPVQATYFDGLWDGIYLGLIEDNTRYQNETENCDNETLRGMTEGWEQVWNVKKARGPEREIKWDNLVFTIDNAYSEVSVGNKDIYDKIIDLSYGVRNG